jgi:hypothetical protein
MFISRDIAPSLSLAQRDDEPSFFQDFRLIER